MCEGYFFPNSKHRKIEYTIFIPGIIILLPLFLQAVHLIDLPTLVCVLLFTNFWFDNIWAKFVRDLIFIFANVWFCIFTLNPWRKAFSKRE